MYIDTTIRRANEAFFSKTLQIFCVRAKTFIFSMYASNSEQNGKRYSDISFTIDNARD